VLLQKSDILPQNQGWKGEIQELWVIIGRFERRKGDGIGKWSGGRKMGECWKIFE
jgi:hypothetical protein